MQVLNQRGRKVVVEEEGSNGFHPVFQIRRPLLAKYLGPCTPSRELDPHVCLEVCLAASVSFRLRPRGISFWGFSFPPTTQMFEAICRAALSCVYNKEVLVWKGRRGQRGGGAIAAEGGPEVTALLM